MRDHFSGENLRIQALPLESLIHNPNNPRHHSDSQIKKLAKSIKAFGFNVPILVDETRTIVAGHGRALAAKRLGLKTVPTISVGHLSPGELKAFSIADNKLTEAASWDEKLFAEQLSLLASLELTFDLDALGFDAAEIDVAIEKNKRQHAHRNSRESDLDVQPLLPEAPVSVPGDIWLLGEHKLICGNALEQAHYESLMGKERAHLVFTDPPYNVPIAGHVSGLGRTQHKDFLMAVGEMSSAQYQAFLETSLAISQPDGIFGKDR